MNPISRLAQIQQAKKEKEPEYVLLSERGMPRRREFIMQVNSGWVSSGFHFATNKCALPQETDLTTRDFTGCGELRGFLRPLLCMLGAQLKYTLPAFAALETQPQSLWGTEVKTGACVLQ